MIALLLIAGFALLWFGAGLLVQNAVSLALRAGVSPLIAGLTIVSFGTSAPELTVSLEAAFSKLDDIAAGNIVGSNIVNTALILGVCAMIRPLTVDSDLLRIDIPVMAILSILAVVLFHNGVLSRIDGLILLLILLIYTGLLIYRAKKQNEVPNIIPQKTKQKPVWAEIILLIAGFAMLIYGSQLFVNGAYELAILLNIPEAVIGVTVVAIGTSLPELSASVMAVIRKNGDLAVGNVIGSNIFNLAGIGGAVSIINPISTAGIGLTDMLFMAGLALLVIPFMWTGFRVARREGIVLLIIFAAYAVYLSRITGV